MSQSRLDAKVTSLTEEMSRRMDIGVDIAQICRTCTRSSQKAIFKCAPDREADIRKVDMNGTTTVVRNSDAVAVSITAKPVRRIVGVNGHRTNTLGIIATCGQKIADKCKSCARFKAIKITVPDGVTDAGRVRYSEIIVGGHCSIPKEGLRIGTKVTHCIKLPLGELVSDENRQSCNTCKYSTSTYSTSMLDHATPLEFDLNPYEKDLISANSEKDQIGINIANARKRMGQVLYRDSPFSKARSYAWVGLSRTYAMAIAPGGVEYNDRGEIVAYRVIIPGYGREITLDATNGDDRLGLVTRVSDDKVVVVIHAPYYRDLGLPDRDSVRRVQLPLEDCPECKGQGFQMRERKDLFTNKVSNVKILCPGCNTGDDMPQTGDPKPEEFRGKRAALPPREVGRYVRDNRLNQNCIDRGNDHTAETKNSVYCSEKYGPCYYHSKTPVQKTFRDYHRTGESGGETRTETDVVFTTPSSEVMVNESPARTAKFIRGARIAIVDGNGDELTPAVFVLRQRSLYAQARTDAERRLIIQTWQHISTPCGVAPRVQYLNYSWNRLSDQDPWAGFCAINAYDNSHGGHVEGTHDVMMEEMGADGVRYEVARGVMARGINFMREHNSQFGTPRSDMSTNIMSHSPMGYIEVLGGKRIRQGLMKDPMFSLPKWQERSEWERVTNPGERLQEQILTNETLIRANRESHGYEPKQMPENPTVIKLGVGIPGAHHIQMQTTQEAYDYLNSVFWLPGNDETQSLGFWMSRRAALLGVNLFNNRPNSDRDIISVEGLKNNMQSDAESPEQEADEFYVCTICYNGDGDTGQFRPEEITDPDMNCPDPECSGVLVLRTRSREWLSGILKMSTEQIKLIAPTYRRTVNDDLSVAPDSRQWQTSQRLSSMYCSNWRPRYTPRKKRSAE